MWKVIDNYFDGKKYVVTIAIQERRFNQITAEFDESTLELDDQKVIEKALDSFYRTHLLGKFINEAVDLAESKAKEIAETAEQINRIKEEYEQELTNVKERSNTTQGALVELIETVFDVQMRLAVLEGADNDTTTETD